jgi:hypothetical protein
MGWPSSRITSQAQLDRLARIRLRFFQGFAIGNHRGQLGAGDREPTFGLAPEAADKRQALADLTSFASPSPV